MIPLYGSQRSALRALFVQQLLTANTEAGPNVLDRWTLPTRVDKLPAIYVTTPADAKQSMLRGGPQFTTRVLVALTVRVSAPTDQVAGDTLERLLSQIDAATLSNQAIIDAVQEFSTVRTDIRINSEGGTPIAEATVGIECEVYEDYRNPPSAPLTDIRGIVEDPDTLAPTLTFDAKLPQ